MVNHSIAIMPAKMPFKAFNSRFCYKLPETVEFP